MGNTHESSASDRLSTTETVTARVVRNLSMTPEANELLASLARERGIREGDVLRLALGMFQVAVDARKEGKHVGVVGSPEVLDLEFVGF
jgi:hypothetical protein